MPVSMWRQIAPAVIAALLVIGGSLVYLQPPQAPDTVPDLNVAPEQFQFVVGAGRSTEKGLLFERFENGMGLASVTGLSIQASRLHWLEADLSRDENAYAPVFFWRQKEQPNEVSRLELPRLGPQRIDLGTVENWQGEIIEIGFVFEDPAGNSGKLAGVALRGDSLALTLSQVMDDWTQHESWSQRSINILYGGPKTQQLALPVVVLAWVVLSLLLYAMINFRRNQRFFSFAATIFLVAWIILDIRWTSNRFRQSAETIDTHVRSNENLVNIPDGALQEYIARLKRDVLKGETGKILLISDESISNYYPLKARYHLLPYAATEWPGGEETFNPEQLDYVLLLQPGYDDYAARNPSFIPPYVWEQVTVPVAWRKHFKLLDVGDFGLLFAVEKPQDGL